jgi:tetratricopeptide (TPR) repeat protein
MGTRGAPLWIGVALACTLAQAAPADPAPDAAALVRELEAHPDDEPLRARTGDALFRAGDAMGSLRVLNPGRTPDAKWVPELREAARVYMDLGQPDAARRALENAIELAPDEASLYEELAQVYASARRQGRALESDPLGDAAEHAPPAPEEDASRASQPAPPAAAAPAASGPLLRVAVLTGIALAAVGIALFARRARTGRGDLVVSIEPPAGHGGTFSVRLSAERERARPRAPSLEPEARASTRFEHFLVARETQFRGLPARSYWVTIEGLIQANGSDARQPVREEREARVEKDRSTRLVVDLRPELAPLELRIVRGGAAVREGRVALGGDPTSLRLAKLGRVRLSVPRGAHRILVGADGAGGERTVLVESFDAQTLSLDLDDPELCVFADCEAALEPFLRGDLSVAAAALERAGQRERADLLLARFHQNRGAASSAAERFEAAGRWLEAAELRADRGEFGKAALLFEKAGDLARAAESHEADGDLLRAGRAFEETGDLDAALRCYRAVGSAPRLVDVLEKKGDAFAAGRLARERGDTARALRNLQQVEPRSPHYAEACRLSAEMLCAIGRPELALGKAEEAMTFGGTEAATPERQLWFADVLEKAGRPDRALRVLEELRECAPTLEGVRTRIEELRKAVSRTRRQGDRTEPVQLFDDASRYELLEQIGSGGMGIVYRARDRRLGREVALKRMPENLKDHPRAVELFLREARASAALNHANIVTVYDVDMESGVYFITMELLEGSTLADLLRARGRLLPLDAVRLGLQVCSGLAFAHAHRIIHRDIKSSNLFLTSERVVKIMDFGLAKMLEEVRRSTTVVGGTPYYMAPEQASGESVDARTDLYALGVTLFELVTGVRPFEEGDVTWHHRNTKPPDPRAKGTEIPEAFASLILSLLAKAPADRPASAEAVARQLQAIAQSLRR